MVVIGLCAIAICAFLGVSVYTKYKYKNTLSEIQSTKKNVENIQKNVESIQSQLNTFRNDLENINKRFDEIEKSEKAEICPRASWPVCAASIIVRCKTMNKAIKNSCPPMEISFCV